MTQESRPAEGAAIQPATAGRFAEGLTYDDKGLLPAIAQDETGAVLMMAWMNADAVIETLTTGQVTYWSRSRQTYWRKGESSGHRQRLIEMRVDCDRDCLLMIVSQTGPACHTNRRSCFYTALQYDGEHELMTPLEGTGQDGSADGDAA